MAVLTCPHCNVRFSVMPHTGDYVHSCEQADSNTLKQEDVLIIGKYTDYENPTQVDVMQGDIVYSALPNKLFGTDAHIQDNANQDPVTARGKNAKIYRQRTKQYYVSSEYINSRC